MSQSFKYIIKLSFLALLCSCTNDETKFGTKVIDSQFAVTLPDYLESMSGLNDDASLQLGDNVREVYMIARFNDWGELRARHSNWEIEDYYDFHIENLLIEIQNPSAPGPDSVSVNGLNALKGYYEGKINNDEIHCKLVMLESRTTLYQVLIWTKTANLALYEKDMDRIIHSFQEL